MKRRAVLLSVALSVVVAACSDPAAELPAPPTTAPTTSTTAAPDLSLIDLGGVPGTTSTTVAIGPGKARLSGVVNGPSGPVPGAHVRVERLVGGGVAVADVQADGAGHWELPRILGGRYRVRAWLAPELALVKPEVLFLGATEERDVPIPVQRYVGLVAVPATAPAPPIVDEPVTLVVQVARRLVDEQGVVRSSSVPLTRLELFGGGAWEIGSANPTTSDSAGRGEWELRCNSTGRHPLTVLVGQEESVPVDVEACALTPPPVASTTTTGGTGTTTGRPRSTTSTTGRRTTTTSA
ncbi:MAG TPA: carboxypeptidase-like regulatory domain-containing protein [Acidimicrobiales bacterium]|nr:carboxypeptidase-like regulatory domain-containing protein [Acidimicrobiales bacterium]